MRTADISYTSTIGNAMSMATINGSNLRDILKSGRDTATSSDTLKNVAVSGLSAGITKGITDKLNLNNPNTFTDKLKESAISNITSTAVQSAINGDSFTESLKHQAINTIVMAGANYAANQIGQQYHTNGFSDNNAINKATQLTLHAGLGAITNALTGNDALSGAVAGVSGEVFAELLGNQLYGTTSGSELNQYQQTVLKEYGGLAAGISSLITGKVQDLDVSDIRDNVYAGYRVGKNAVENNLLAELMAAAAVGTKTAYIKYNQQEGESYEETRQRLKDNDDTVIKVIEYPSDLMGKGMGYIIRGIDNTYQYLMNTEETPVQNTLQGLNEDWNTVKNYFIETFPEQRDWIEGGLDAVSTGLTWYGVGSSLESVVIKTKNYIEYRNIKKDFYNNPLNNTTYTEKVLQQKSNLSDIGHAFNDKVDDFAGFGQTTNIIGNDGLPYIKIKIDGSYNGVDGYFEWIKNPRDSTINHRDFFRNIRKK